MADARINIDATHLNFKLDKSGDELFLIQIVGNDTLILDKTTYNAVSGQHTVGRFPNISGSFKALNQGTPGYANIDIPDDIQNLAMNAKNISILFNQKNKFIIIEPENEYFGKKGFFSLTDITGKVLLKEIINFSSSKTIDLSSKKPCMYLIQLFCNNKNFTKKIIIQ